MAGSAAAVRPVIPAFEVEFTGSDGGCCRGRLGELWSTPFERVAPVRSFPSFRGQVSFSGLYYAATVDAHVGFESWLERDVVMMLDFEPAVVAFSSQPFWLTWAQDGGQRRHAPDYFARLADGKTRWRFDERQHTVQARFFRRGRVGIDEPQRLAVRPISLPEAVVLQRKRAIII